MENNYFSDHFDPVEIQSEVESRKRTGDLDLVFKKYCGDPVRDTRPCLEAFLEASRLCLDPSKANEQSNDDRGLNMTMSMVDAAIEFICHNNGDRLARKKHISFLFTSMIDRPVACQKVSVL